MAALNGEINGVDERLAALDAQIAEAKKLPQYQGVVYITDQRQKKVITTYKTNQADSSSDSSSSVPRGYELDLGQLLRYKL